MSTKPLVIVVMGVSGAGKTRFGSVLARTLQIQFQDGDDLHPTANIAKMRQGVALSDADRAPWLAAVKAWIEATMTAQACGVIACSALRHAYRRELIGSNTRIALVHLTGDIKIIHERLQNRRGHFMPDSLLDSQIAALEPPTLDEGAIVADVAWPLDRQIRYVLKRLREMGLRP